MFWDIETSPNVVYSWRVGRNISLSTDNIVKERKIICICWKWEDEDCTYSLDWGKEQDDKLILEEFGEELNKASVAIAHNGDHFDVKWVKARNMYHGLPPITNVSTIDTLKMMRQNFNFNSNRLDYLGGILDVGRKIDTGGFSLWKRVMDGDKKALKEMLDYCSQDVLLLEEFYQKIRPYVDSSPVHMGILNNDSRDACPQCGSLDVIKHSIAVQKAGKYQKWQCKNCGHVHRDNRQLKEKKKCKYPRR